MIIQLILIGFSLLLRTLGALGRSKEKPYAILFIGWFVAGLGAWLGAVAAGGWPPLWSLLIVAGLPILAVWEKRPFSLLTLFADALIVLVVGLFGLPPFEISELLAAIILIPAVGWVVDWSVTWLQNRLPRRVMAGVTAVILLLAIFTPPISDTVNRIVQSRFAYLLPQQDDSVVGTKPPTPTATGGADETAVSQSTPLPTPVTPQPSQTNSYPRTAVTQWAPYAEWEVENTSYRGNPFDIIASATFVHQESGQSHTTGLFYNGNDQWRFRFAGTLPGLWTFTTQSEDAELDGLNGEVMVDENPGTPGFVTNFGNKWGRTGTNEAFVPQFVMIGNPETFHNNPAEIDHIIQTFFVEHGFNGVHTPVFCRWFDISQQRCSNSRTADPNPDIATFEALEQLIVEVHAAGGVVHIWMWGDDSRSENPKRWGLNGPADLRLQRYIAARLGALPGWTMGYGYDLYEWVNTAQLDEWYTHMEEQLGWQHYLGARGRTNSLVQLSENMTYASYEQHRPSYEVYVNTLAQYPEKPAFSEDRFRIRNQGRAKDYDMEETRRGLWRSTMAGGVANIWGNLIGAAKANDSLRSSAPYPNPEMIQTYARFWQERFVADMVLCNDLTDEVCLRSPGEGTLIFYGEDVEVIEMDLGGTAGGTAVAVDTKLAYQEIELGHLDGNSFIWQAPYLSDWAILILIDEE